MSGIMDTSNYGNPSIFMLKFQNSITHNYGNPQIFKKKFKILITRNYGNPLLC